MIELEMMRASALLESDPASAARRASLMLKHNPGHEAAQLLLATACRRMGDAVAARNLLSQLAAAQPESAVLQLELGRACAADGHTAEAVRAFETAVALDVRLADAWRELAAQRYQAGDTVGGDRAYGHYDAVAPEAPELKDAAMTLGERRLDAAIGILQRHLRSAPDDVRALRMMATIARVRDESFECEEYLQRCLRVAPGYAAARSELATDLCAQQRHEEAAPHVDRLLAAEPGNIEYIRLRAQALRFYGRSDEAIALMRGLIAEYPDNGRLLLYYGQILREAGDQKGAIAAYREALALEPGMGEAYGSMADLKTVRFTSADRDQMEHYARTLPAGSGRTQLEFALGKACEDAGDYALAFEHYQRGNTLHRDTVYFGPEELTLGVGRSKAFYTPAFFAERAGWGCMRDDPIFVLGMPRSGSTLLEQILASHSQVEGTRELPDIPGIVREMVFKVKDDADANYPDLVGGLGRAEIAAYAERYLQRTAVHRTRGRPRFVDKMPGNFMHVGLIHLMFPNATIIDARRHPMGCCFSCYRQFFGRGHHFSYNLKELGQHYRDYWDLMEHFDTVLPGRVYRVHYEQMVADVEGEVRRLLEHCRLPFEPGCLRFYETKRAVTTISSEQVRRPISSDAVDQWRHFEPWLGELKAALGDLVDRYPVAPAPKA